MLLIGDFFDLINPTRSSIVVFLSICTMFTSDLLRLIDGQQLPVFNVHVMTI